MASVRGRGNKSTEERLAHQFRRMGIKGWRRHLPLPGSPDFAFPKSRLAIFCDGCFWHGCPKHATFPTTRRTFWLRKFADNKARDSRVNLELRQSGWRVMRIWEHDLAKRPEWCALKVGMTLDPREKLTLAETRSSVLRRVRIRRAPLQRIRQRRTS